MIRDRSETAALVVDNPSTPFLPLVFGRFRPATPGVERARRATWPDMPDFFDLSRHFLPEERTIRDTVRAFVDARVLPVIGEHFERGTFPTELIPEIANLGLLGCNLQGYGCAGLSDIGYGLAMQELERGDSGVRSFASVQGSLVMYPIHAFGSEEQKERYLPKMAKGEIIGCFGLTEPDFGSNPSGMRTVAIEDGGDYRPANASGLVWIGTGQNELFGGNNKPPGGFGFPIVKSLLGCQRSPLSCALTFRFTNSSSRRLLDRPCSCLSGESVG